MTKVRIQHPKLSISAKCRLLSISRASVYYEARPIPPDDLAILREIDQYFLDNPCLGSRKMTALLRRSGHVINRKKAQRLMRQLAEETGRPNSPPYVPSLALHRERQKVATPLSIGDVYQRIWRGSYPAMIGADASLWAEFYESYLSTYIQQDIRTYLDVASIEDFYKFMQVAAARTGQLVNYADMAQDVGIRCLRSNGVMQPNWMRNSVEGCLSIISRMVCTSAAATMPTFRLERHCCTNME